MPHVCAELSTPIEGQTQTCVAWAEYSPVLPPLTKAEADQILLWFISLLAIVVTVKQLKRFF